MAGKLRETLDSGGSEFPIWIPIMAAIALIGIGAGVFVFLKRRP